MERSDTHHGCSGLFDGYRTLNPSYESVPDFIRVTADIKTPGIAGRFYVCRQAFYMSMLSDRCTARDGWSLLRRDWRSTSVSGSSTGMPVLVRPLSRVQGWTLST